METPPLEVEREGLFQARNAPLEVLLMVLARRAGIVGVKARAPAGEQC